MDDEGFEVREAIFNQGLLHHFVDGEEIPCDDHEGRLTRSGREERMEIYFHTNLDETKGDVGRLNDCVHRIGNAPVPRKGERIRFTFDGNKNYDLEVVDVVYRFDGASPAVLVELHMPSYYGAMSIAEWSKWFQHHRLGRV